MAWCLTAPSHYLNQCWLIIHGFLWRLPMTNFTGCTQDIYSYSEFEKNTLVKLLPNSESIAGDWLNQFRLLTKHSFYHKFSVNISIDNWFCNRFIKRRRLIFSVNHSGASLCLQSQLLPGNLRMYDTQPCVLARDLKTPKFCRKYMAKYGIVTEYWCIAKRNSYFFAFYLDKSITTVFIVCYTL